MSEPRMRSFLLGTMPEAAQRQLEEEFFESHETYEALQDSLNDLLDEYARGELDRDGKLLVEQRILCSPRNRARLVLAQALAQRETRGDSAGFRAQRMGPRAAWLWAAASVAAVSIAGAVWMRIDDSRVRGELRAAQAAIASRNRIGVATTEIVSITLYSQLTRGSENLPTLVLPGGKTLVRVDLVTDEVFPQYSAALETRGAGRVWEQQGLARGTDGSVTLWLPATVIKPGSHEFLLYGIGNKRRELIGSYQLKAGEKPASTNPAQ